MASSTNIKDNAALIQSFCREFVQNMIDQVIVTDELKHETKMAADDGELVDEIHMAVIGDVLESLLEATCCSGDSTIQEGADGDNLRPTG